jgi:hypothetical protein
MQRIYSNPDPHGGILRFDWTVTEMWMNGYWNVTERLLTYDWAFTEMWLNGYWDVIERLLRCKWTVTEMWLNGYWDVTERLLRCDWTVTEMWLNLYCLFCFLCLFVYSCTRNFSGSGDKHPPIDLVTSAVSPALIIDQLRWCKWRNPLSKSDWCLTIDWYETHHTAFDVTEGYTVNLLSGDSFSLWFCKTQFLKNVSIFRSSNQLYIFFLLQKVTDQYL